MVTGLVPLQSIINYVTQKTGYQRSHNWTPGSLALVQQLLGLASKLEAEVWSYDDKTEAYCGDLFMWFDPDDLARQGMRVKRQPLSLSKVLCKKRLAELSLSSDQQEYKVWQEISGKL